MVHPIPPLLIFKATRLMAMRWEKTLIGDISGDVACKWIGEGNTRLMGVRRKGVQPGQQQQQ